MGRSLALFLCARAVVGPTEVRFAHPVRLAPDTNSQGRCSVTCKLLCIRCLTEIRVMVFTTLKIPNMVIICNIRVTHDVNIGKLFSGLDITCTPSFVKTGKNKYNLSYNKGVM